MTKKKRTERKDRERKPRVTYYPRLGCNGQLGEHGVAGRRSQGLRRTAPYRHRQICSSGRIHLTSTAESPPQESRLRHFWGLDRTYCRQSWGGGGLFAWPRCQKGPQHCSARRARRIVVWATNGRKGSVRRRSASYAGTPIWFLAGNLNANSGHQRRGLMDRPVQLSQCSVVIGSRRFVAIMLPESFAPLAAWQPQR